MEPVRAQRACSGFFEDFYWETGLFFVTFPLYIPPALCYNNRAA